MPANTSDDWLETARPHIWLPYTQMKTAFPPLGIESADGVRLKLADGRELVDGIASWWTAAHGYNHPHIIEAITKQAETLPHAMFGGLVTEPAARLSERLARLLPGDLNHVFIAESGSVSVEVAMKMALQYFLNRGELGRTKFLSFKGGYHGDTLTVMSVCDPEEGMHSLFTGAIQDQHVLDLPRNEGVMESLDDFLFRRSGEIAAILVEPLVQGAGGMVFHDAETLARLRELADRHGLLLITDEIFTGFGRTGTMFACEQAGIVPDIMTLSKALTGGTMPLSVAVARAHVFDAFWSDDPNAALMHGPTFQGHAIGCAAAIASLDLFETEPRLDQVAAISAQLEAELSPLRGKTNIRDVRVKGAIGVVQLDDIGDVNTLKSAFVERGVWIRPFRDIVYLTPPLVIEPDDLSILTSAIVDVLNS